jgi:hypothetical protein
MFAQLDHPDFASRRDGWFAVSQTELASLTGLSRSTVNTAVKTLKSADYIQQRPRVSQSGSRLESEYRIVFDGTLPAKFDRHRHLETLEKAAVQNLGMAEENGGKADVQILHTPSQNLGAPSVTRRKDAVQNSDSLSEDSNNKLIFESRLDSSLEPDTKQGPTSTQNRFESSSSFENNLEESVVNNFLAYRTKLFPDARSRPTAVSQLLEQARKYLYRGLSAEQITRLLLRLMSSHSTAGKEAPTGITRYCRDLDTLLKNQKAPAPYIPAHYAKIAEARRIPPEAQELHAEWRAFVISIPEQYRNIRAMMDGTTALMGNTRDGYKIAAVSASVATFINNHEARVRRLLGDWQKTQPAGIQIAEATINGEAETQAGYVGDLNQAVAEPNLATVAKGEK